ncbi:hypothetical protein RhiirA4_474228 [Rhizophagus irregularis]|uniref:Uncharacterized protein n=1 Tax=Rhizophagus irregularis TaxID=588596 RepID=A0A2I1H553_9GLOM|nr:hypothetical protein RhiirA4_500353 [Rhizophagus irregularis]PKY55032.1 hypothetical protein RhiirA4_474228 [Rhizophagus irregularis]
MKLEEIIEQYLKVYYGGFIGFETKHVTNFTKTLMKYKRFNLPGYETEYLDKESLFPPGEINIGVRDETVRRGTNVYQDTLMDIAAFTMKLGGETLKRTLREIMVKIRKDADAAVEDVTNMMNELESYKVRCREAENKIDNLEKEKKIAEERIISLENDVIKLQELEKNKKTSEISTSSKQTKSHDRRRKTKKKKSSTQEIKKGKITEIPVETTSDDYLEKHFAERSRDLKFYDFPAHWKDTEIYESLNQMEL